MTRGGSSVFAPPIFTAFSPRSQQGLAALVCGVCSHVCSYKTPPKYIIILRSDRQRYSLQCGYELTVDNRGAAVSNLASTGECAVIYPLSNATEFSYRYKFGSCRRDTGCFSCMILHRFCRCIFVDEFVICVQSVVPGSIVCHLSTDIGAAIVVHREARVSRSKGVTVVALIHNRTCTLFLHDDYEAK